jgi:fumarate hydratase class II
MRTEHDTMGDVTIPDGAWWGAQTQRAVENFPVSGQPVPWELVWALLVLKGAAATVNGKRGIIDREVAAAIRDTATEVARGGHEDQFPVDVFQTGSGTSTNMNVNEVLAYRASERVGRAVHANDEVNASQSSNDVFPSAIRVAACFLVVHRVLPSLDQLHGALYTLGRRHEDTVKAGRTHLMDAAPITFGQEVGGWARAVALAQSRLRDVLPRLGELPLGGTAVGTGLNAPAGFARDVVHAVATDLGLPLTEAVDHFEAQSAQDALVEVSGATKVAALTLHKIAGDLRLLGSGPATGLREVRLPALQPGSSIMPGKVNPVVPEAVQQVVAQIVGNDAAVTFGATLSTLQLSTAMPMMGRNVIESLRLLGSAARLLADRAIAGLEVDDATMRRYAESSSAVATALNPIVGYEAAARVVKRSLQEGRSVREIVLEERLVDGDALDRALDVLPMTRPPGRRSSEVGRGEPD